MTLSTTLTQSVLLIEDNPADAFYVQELLDKPEDNIYLSTVTHLKKGLEFLNVQRCSAVILDLSLPDSQGLDTLTQFLKVYPKIPVIVATGDDNPDLGLQAIELGAQDFLVKGTFNRDTLLHTLRYSQKRQELVNQYQRLSLRDDLTHLPNRLSFNTYLEKITQSLDVLNMGILFIDINQFKAINDEHGHLVGDRILQEVGQRFKNVIRKGDLVSRFGGDEFCIVVRDCESKNSLEHMVKRVIHAMKDPIDTVHQLIPVSISVGVAYSDLKYKNMDHMIACADQAMYAAKEASPLSSNAVFFTRDMFYEKTRKDIFFDDLNELAPQSDLEIDCHPVVSLTTRQAHSVYPVIRWNHPRWQHLSSAELQHLTKFSKRSEDIGLHLLKAALNQPLNVFLPLSERGFLNPNTLDLLLSHLENSDKAPQEMTLMLHQSVLEAPLSEPADFKAWQKHIQNYRNHGFRFYLKDFLSSNHSINDWLELKLDGVSFNLNEFRAHFGEFSNYTCHLSNLIDLFKARGINILVHGVNCYQEILFLKDCEVDDMLFESRPLDKPLNG